MHKTTIMKNNIDGTYFYYCEECGEVMPNNQERVIDKFKYCPYCGIKITWKK